MSKQQWYFISKWWNWHTRQQPVLVWMWGRKFSYSLLIGMPICLVFWGKNMNTAQRTRNQASIWPINSTSWHLDQRLKNWLWKDICLPMFIAALLIKVKIWTQSKYSRTDDGIKKPYGTYTHGILVSCKKKIT